MALKFKKNWTNSCCQDFTIHKENTTDAYHYTYWFHQMEKYLYVYIMSYLDRLNLL